jgi:predicted secreted protein
MATRALGTTISKGGVLIGGLTEIQGIDKSADTIDVTTLDSTGGYREFIGGFKDGGEVSISGFFVPGNVGQAALETAFESGASDTFIITFPATMGATWTFTGIVTKITTGATIEDPVSFEATVKVSGQPALGTTASTGMSAGTFVKTDGSTALTAAAMTPTFAIGTFFYGFTFTTETSFKPKFTAASHTILLYVDGVYTESLASGSAGTAIAIDAAATKEIKAIVYESGKTPKTYTFMVARLS